MGWFVLEQGRCLVVEVLCGSLDANRIFNKHKAFKRADYLKSEIDSSTSTILLENLFYVSGFSISKPARPPPAIIRPLTEDNIN